MIKNVLVGLDGSTLAEAVLPYVKSLAKSTGIEVILARAVSDASTTDFLIRTIPHVLPYAGYRSTESATPVVAETPSDHDEAERYLEDVAARLRSRGVAVETAVLVGEPAPALIAEADLRQADLIFLCTHGRSGISRLVYGSVAEAVVAGSHVPVFLARAWGRHAARPFEATRKMVLVPVDGTPRAARAVAIASGLAIQLGQELRLLRVVPPLDEAALGPERWIVDVSPAALEAEETQAVADVDAQAATLLQSGIAATATVRLEPVGMGIVDEARECGATMIVLATHPHTGLARLLVHSVALEVLHRTELPMVLIGPSVPDDAAGV
jgi:nucleotide-binding universal stress UspA family protein